MGNEDCNLTSCLDSLQSFMQPCEDIAWVVTLCHQIEVHRVASLSVNGNDVHIVEVLCKACGLILNLELLCIVTRLSINSLSSLIKVFSPLLKVEGDHRILLREVLGVGRDKVVVALQRVQLVVGKVSLEEIGQALL